MRPTHKSVYIVLIDSTDTDTDTDRQTKAEQQSQTSSSCTPEKTEGAKAASRRNSSSAEEERLENFTDVEKHHSHEQNSKSGE
jgi:hypothetical protein